MDPDLTLGPPDYPASLSIVPLGEGGELVLEFVDNALTTSGDETPDLHVFEAGSAVEIMNIAISTDATDWIDLGNLSGQPTNIDIDSVPGVLPGTRYRYVRVRDVYPPAQGGYPWGGADIDAVGALSSAPPVPTCDLEGISDSRVTTDTQGLATRGEIRVEVQNLGATDMEYPFTVTVFEDLDHDGLFDPGSDRILGEQDYTSTLKAGNYANLFIPVDGGLSFKGNRLFALVDSDDAFVETDEDNNLATTGSQSVDPDGDPAPDLVPSFIRFDQSDCGDALNITVRIGNGGAEVVPAGAAVELYGEGRLVSGAQTSIDLAPGEFEDVTLRWNNPPPDEATVTVVVDDANGVGAVVEGNENNNQAAATGASCPAPTPCIESLQARSRTGLVQLTWSDVPDTLEYRILRGTSMGDPLVEIASTNSSYSTYADQSVSNALLYYYQILRIPTGGGSACRSRIVAAVAPAGRVRMAYVPELGGKEESSAESVLAAAHLTLGFVAEDYSDSMGPGLVISQDPPNNSFIPSGSAVDIVVSKGPARVAVPDLIASYAAEAEVAVHHAGLTVGALSTAPSDTMAAGRVLEQSPGAGTSVAKATPVVLTISSGPERALVPDVVGQPQALAEGLVGNSGLSTGTTNTANSGFVPVGEVMIQRPNAGKAVLPNSTIDLLVSAGPGNRAPVITTVPSTTTATQGNTYSYDVDAIDPDGDTLTFSLASAPTGMSIDPFDGLVQWSPTGAQVGNHDVAIRVTDNAGLSSSQAFTMEVGAQQGVVPDLVGQTVAGAEASVQAAGLTIGSTTSTSNNTVPAGNIFDQSPIPGTVLSNGGHVNIVVSTGAEPQGNAPPAITSIPGQEAFIGTAYRYDIAVSDPDGDTLSLLLQDAPVGMTLNTGDRLLLWTPAPSQLGAHAVTLRVEDPNGSSATQAFDILVANRAPEIVSTSPLVATVGSQYTYDVQAVDADGQALTYALLAAPAGMTINAASGLIQWTPAEIQTAGVAVQVSDGAGGFAEEHFSITVNEAAVTVPDLVGQALANAQTAVNAAGLAVGSLTEQSSEILAAGLVLSQTPPAGASVAKGTSVDVVVSTGSGLVLVPNVIGLSFDLAREVIDSAGLTEGALAFVTVPEGSVATRSVTAQSPAPGEKIAQGSPVDLTVALVSSENPEGDTTAPTLDAQFDRSPAAYDQGETARLTIDAVDDSGEVTLQVALDNGVPTGSIQPGDTVELDTLGFALGSVHKVDIRATDPSGNSSALTLAFSVKDPADTTPPEVALGSPDELAEITFLSDVVGTVYDDHLMQYELLLRPSGQNASLTLARGYDPVSDDVLGALDATLLENGMYHIELVAQDVNGQTATIERAILVEGGAKVGVFTLSFIDLDIPLSGIPIQVIRTYDNRVKTSEDFGVGWRLGIRRGSFRHNRKPGDGWQLLSGTGLFGLPCAQISETATHTSEVRLSDVEYYRFRLRLANPAITSGGCFADAYFEFLDGTVPGATLDILGNNYVFYATGSDEVLDYDTYQVYDPGAVRLTTPDGRKIDLDRSAGGIVHLEDANGNSLSITANGIFHSSGESIRMVRDTSGRITQILDPAGHQIQYAYDGAGDLVSYTDQTLNRTTFTYNPYHDLIDIYDPLGNRAIRSEYDADGRLIATTDADGNRLELTHDLANRAEVVRDRRGNVTVNEYDDEGNVLAVTDALGNVTRYTYDGRGNELTVTDPLGHTTSRTYDVSRNVLTETDPLGNVTSHTYNGRNQVLTTTDPQGRVTGYQYDAGGNLLGITDPAGSATTTGYDRRGNLTSLSDALGNTSSFAYDAAGNRIQETDPLGRVTAYTFDAIGNELTRTTTWTDAAGVVHDLVTRKEYDALGRVVRTVDPLGNSTSTEYNAIGKVAAEVDALGRRTEYDYDARGNRIGTRYPDGSQEISSYDAEGNQSASTDRGGRITRFTYDALNRLVRTLYADGSSTQSLFDAAGHEIAAIDANGNRTATEYDAAGNRTGVVDALGNTTRFEYDAAGQQIWITDALGNSTGFEYDAAGRRTRTHLPDGTATSLAYDAGGRLTQKSDAAGNTTAYEYDPQGRLVAVVDALGQRTAYGYDEAGNLVTQTDANGNTTTYEYDALGRRIATVLPMGQRSSITYDAVGNALSQTDFNGDTITYAYDVNGRLITRNNPDGSAISFTYTPTGQRASVTDARGLTQYQYDTLDRLMERADPDGAAISYTYDVAGNRTSVTTPAGTAGYTFDALDRLATVEAPDGGMTSYTYDSLGRLIHTDLPNGTEERRTYDENGRLLAVESSDSATGTVFSGFTYTLDPNGNRVAVEEQDGRRVEYGYDALQRLIRETIFDAGSGTASQIFDYVYDPVGNRLSRDDTQSGETTYAYDDNDRLVGESTLGVSTTYGYDDNGNLVAKTEGGVTQRYRWDTDNRLVGADMDGNGAEELGYAYDADGIRVSKSRNGVEIAYLIDANRPYAQVLEERDGSGATEVAYVYGNDLIAQTRGGSSAFYHVDGLGSTRALTDVGGNLSDTYTFDAYGRTIAQNGFTDNAYLYAGEQRDADLGLDYLRARYLDVSSGRFISRDPFDAALSTPRSRHEYIYAENNTPNRADPSGLFSLVLVGNLSGFASANAIGAHFNRTNAKAGLKAIAALLYFVPEAMRLQHMGLLGIADGVPGAEDMYLLGVNKFQEAISQIPKAFKSEYQAAQEELLSGGLTVHITGGGRGFFGVGGLRNIAKAQKILSKVSTFAEKATKWADWTEKFSMFYRSPDKVFIARQMKGYGEEVTRLFSEIAPFVNISIGPLKVTGAPGKGGIRQSVERGKGRYDIKAPAFIFRAP